ncbi:MAG: HEAT repeat domain-containing protein [Planctomycetes bacterium]|nr:HEAT repeat domain-containing protein [Planctomycetota bacterium]
MARPVGKWLVGGLVALGVALTVAGRAYLTARTERERLEVPRWIEELKSPDARTRLTAAHRLGDLGAAGATAAPALRAVEHDPDPLVREAVAGALRRVGGGR